MIKPGIYDNLSSAEYHADPALSRSTLREMRFSPAHCKHRMETPISDTPAMLLGRAVHSWVLEPDVWDSEWTVFDGAKARTAKAYKDFAKEETRGIVLQAEYDLVRRISDAVNAHAMAGGILAEAKTESSVFWEWADGHICKCRPDLWVEDTVWDLKTTTDASPDGFRREITKFGYHHQGAWYTTGAKAKNFGFICVEKVPPYGVGVYLLDENFLMAGYQDMSAWMERFMVCKEQDVWPGYGETVQTINKPDWME